MWGARPLSRVAAASEACLLLTITLAGCTAAAPPILTPGATSDATASPSEEPSASGPAAALTSPTLPTPTSEPTAAPTATVYVVQPGDSLISIASRFGVSVGQIMAANPDIEDADAIQAGDSITIPTPDAPTGPPRQDGISDARGDPLDPDDQPTYAIGAVDLTGLGARVDAATVFIQLNVVAPPPAASPDVEQIIYTVNIDTTGDGEPDFRLLASNALAPGVDYAAVFIDLAASTTTAVGSFPGTFEVEGTAIRFEVLRSALGDPRQYAIAATAERRFYPGGVDDPEVEAAVDRAPDQQWPRVNARWLEIGR
jgi:LysM repeat protein